MIDLHTHSTYSDGSLTPREIVGTAVEAGLTAVALTDHDCMDGVEELLAACKNGEGSPHLTGIPGVEISADVAPGTMHVLGYFPDHRNVNLSNALRQIREGRSVRNHRIIERLNALGMQVEWEEVEALAGESVVGRPHFAMAMVKKGYVRDKEQAFVRHLAKGKPAYVDRFRLSPEGCVEIIRQAGGVAVLAHPSTLELAPGDLRQCVLKLKDAGLQGIEVYYPEHRHAKQQEYLQLARELELVATGGTDFHGSFNPAVRIGTGFGSLRVEDAVLDALMAARA